MWAMIIDGDLKGTSEESTKPLIEALDHEKVDRSHSTVVLRWVDDDKAACGHDGFGKAAGKIRCAEMTCDNYYSRHWTSGL